MDIRQARKPVGTMPQRTETHVTESVKTTPPILEDKPEDIVIQQYLDFLEKNEVSRDDIKRMLSTLLTEGTVSCSVQILQSIPVVFTTRPAWVDDYIISQVDDLARSVGASLSVARVNSFVALHNVAGSLTQYKDKLMPVHTEDDFNSNLEFVRSLPSAIHNALTKQLVVFERAVAVATSDWAVENFTAQSKEK